MKYVSFGIVVCALFGLVAASAMPAPSLQVAQVNTRAFLCDGQNHETFTDVPAGARIRKIIVWMGTYNGMNADVVFAAERVDAAGQYHQIAIGGWDRYATPTGIANQFFTYDYTPDWIGIGNGERLAIEAQCNPMNKETREKKAHVIANVFYLK